MIRRYVEFALVMIMIFSTCRAYAENIMGDLTVSMPSELRKKGSDLYEKDIGNCLHDCVDC